MLKFGKIRNNYGKPSTHKADNFFWKEIFVMYVHEIALKYPRGEEEIL
jgi:hypothetical protein